MGDSGGVPNLIRRFFFMFMSSGVLLSYFHLINILKKKTYNGITFQIMKLDRFYSEITNDRLYVKRNEYSSNYYLLLMEQTTIACTIVILFPASHSILHITG